MRKPRTIGDRQFLQSRRGRLASLPAALLPVQRGLIWWSRVDRDAVVDTGWAITITNFMNYAQSLVGAPAGKVEQLGGSLALRCGLDGAVDYQFPAGVFGNLTQAEWYCVVSNRQQPTALGHGAKWNMGNGIDAVTNSYWPYSSNDVYSNFGTTVRKDTISHLTDARLAPDTPFLVHEFSQNGAWESWFDETLIYQTPTNAIAFAAAPNKNHLFSVSTDYHYGHFWEILVYGDVQLTVNERDKNAKYFKSRYSGMLP